MVSSTRVRMALQSRIAGWVGVVLFGLPTLLFVDKGDTGAAALFTGLALCSLYVLAYSFQTIEFSPHSVTLHTLLHRYRMAWEDVRHAEIDQSNWSLVLEGQDRRLVLPGTSMWRMTEKYAAIEACLAMLELHGITMQTSAKANFKFSRHTRIA